MMMNVRLLTLNSEEGERKIFPSPVMLHKKDDESHAESRAGKFTKLFFYENFENKAYKAHMMEMQKRMPDMLKEELVSNTIFMKQDLSSGYIGYLHIDFAKKTYSIPEDQAHKTAELKLLGDMFFRQMEEQDPS